VLQATTGQDLDARVGGCALHGAEQARLSDSGIALKEHNLGSAGAGRAKVPADPRNLMTSADDR